MFTGIIEEVGSIAEIQNIAGGKKLKISAEKIMEDISVNDSVCVNGVCLTAIKIDKNGFWIEAVGATIDKTTFGNVYPSMKLNLERSLKLNDRLSGHFVQGHVNGVGIISQIKKLGENYLLEVEVPDNLNRYLISEGSIAIDGVSLTIANLNKNVAGISIIPHTWKNTSIQFYKEGDGVNIETDVIAKYIEKLIAKDKSPIESKITETWLKELGY